RSGTMWSSFAHIITGVIGSGVLTLAWSMAQLGWIAGPLTMLAFALVTIVSAFLLSNCYRSFDAENRLCRNASYREAVQRILGKSSGLVCGVITQLGFFKVGVVYTIASSVSMGAIQRSNCFRNQGREAICGNDNTTYYTLIFGIVQVAVSQIPDFSKTKWLSVFAAAMSFSYSAIGSGLGLAKVIEDREVKGSIWGVPASTAVDKLWGVAQALGNIGFSFPFTVIFLEIMDTLKSDPAEKVTMKKASILSVSVTCLFYFLCGGLGYAAFGNSTPGNILTAFGDSSSETLWVVGFANACVVLHLVGAYQMFSQALYANIEKSLKRSFPNNRLFQNEVNPIARLCLRSAYVSLTTGVALIFPYFNQAIAVSGAVSFWPTVVYFPAEMYLKQKSVPPCSWKSIALRAYCLVGLVVMSFALVGS
ncbi:hypothetical protein M569_07918, partial [Genlisea aurea]